MVCANAGGALQSFGFILEQDLSDVPLEREFAVDTKWRPFMIALRGLENLLTGMRFAPAVVAADQFRRDGGDEIAREIARK